MESWRVWDEVPLQQCWGVTGKAPLGGRWVDSNKGDRTAHDIRSRWVAKDIAFHKSDAFFSVTPPLEAMRPLLSEAASQGNRAEQALKVMLLDA